MGYILGGKNLSVNNKTFLDKDRFIYDYNDIALKVYPKGRDTSGDMGLSVAKRLIGIDTERLLLPKSTLFFNEKYAGYSFQKPSKGMFCGSIIDSSRENIISGIECLERDFDLLSENNILFSATTEEDVLYDDELFLFTHCYSFMKEHPNLQQYNREQLHWLLTSLVKSELEKSNVDVNVILQAEKLFGLKEAGESSSEFFGQILDRSTISQFVKKTFK